MSKRSKFIVAEGLRKLEQSSEARKRPLPRNSKPDIAPKASRLASKSSDSDAIQPSEAPVSAIVADENSSLAANSVASTSAVSSSATSTHAESIKSPSEGIERIKNIFLEKSLSANSSTTAGTKSNVIGSQTAETKSNETGSPTAETKNNSTSPLTAQTVSNDTNTLAAGTGSPVELAPEDLSLLNSAVNDVAFDGKIDAIIENPSSLEESVIIISDESNLLSSQNVENRSPLSPVSSQVVPISIPAVISSLPAHNATLVTNSSLNNATGNSEEHPLDVILNADSDGQRVLSYWNLKSKLNPAKRSLLCAVLVRFELLKDADRRLDAHDFQRLSALICSRFPTEIPVTYYVPFQPKTAHRKKKLASGKLWNRYTNYCKTMRDDGSRKTHNKSAVESVHQVQYDTGNVSLEDHNKAVQWLATSTTPWTVVKDKWSLTAARRLKSFEDKDVPINEYFEIFRALNVAEAYDLMSIDFAVKFPGFQNRLFDEWPTVVDSIFKYVEDRAKEERSFAKSLETHKLPMVFEDVDLSEEQRNITAVRLLLHIVPLRSTPTKKKKKSQDQDTPSDSPDEVSRLSRIEVANRFLMIVPSTTTFQTDIKERVKAYTKSKKRCQTFIVCVGEEPEFTYFVYFQGIFYTANDLVSAIDLSFKFYMVLNAAYPAENLLVWLFIQEFIYKLHTEHDEAYVSSLSTLASDLDLA